MEQITNQMEEVLETSQGVSSKNYKYTFWKLFIIGMITQATLVLSSPPDSDTKLILLPIALIGMIIIIILWMVYFNQAWKVVGDRYGWLNGLIVLFPFGQIVALIVVYLKLKGTKYWT